MRMRARLLLSTAFSLVLAAAQAQGFGGVSGMQPSNPCGANGRTDNGCSGSSLWVPNPATIYPNMFVTLGPGGAGTGTGNASGGFYFAQRPTENVAGVDYPVGSADPSTLNAVTSTNYPTLTGGGCTYTASWHIVGCSVASNITITGWDFTDYTLKLTCTAPHTITLIGNHFKLGPDTGATSVYTQSSPYCAIIGHNNTFDNNTRAYANYLFATAPGSPYGSCAAAGYAAIDCYNAGANGGIDGGISDNDAIWALNPAYRSFLYMDYTAFLDIGSRAFTSTTDGNLTCNYCLIKDQNGLTAHAEASLSYTHYWAAGASASTLTAGSPDTISLSPMPAGASCYPGEPIWYQAGTFGDLNTNREPLWITSCNPAAGTFQFSQTYGGTPYSGTTSGSSILNWATGPLPSVFINGSTLLNSTSQIVQDGTGMISPNQEAPAGAIGNFQDIAITNNVEIADQMNNFVSVDFTANPTSGQTLTLQACSGPPGACVASGTITTITFGTTVAIGSSSTATVTNLVTYLNTNSGADPRIGNYQYASSSGYLMARGPYSVAFGGTAPFATNQFTTGAIEEQGGMAVVGEFTDTGNWRAPYGVYGCFLGQYNQQAGWNNNPNYYFAKPAIVSGNVNMLGTAADPNIDAYPCHTTNY